MNYEKAYKEALERAKKVHDGELTISLNEVNDFNVYEYIFPELHELEDERIRKEIIQSIQDNMCVIHKDKCIAWLEKQGEKSWSEEDEYQFNTILHGLDLKRELYKKEGNQAEEERYKTQYDWLKSLKPRWKPTEEQMKEALQTEYEKGRFDMREEMMKDAVNGEVVYQIGSAEIAPTDIRYKVVSDRVYIPNVKLGDKVKLIIIKEEQQ